MTGSRGKECWLEARGLGWGASGDNSGHSGGMGAPAFRGGSRGIAMWEGGIRRAPFLSCSRPDTLLNVFLAIAVDNLANAQELTKVRRWGRVQARSLSMGPESREGGQPRGKTCVTTVQARG